MMKRKLVAGLIGLSLMGSSLVWAQEGISTYPCPKTWQTITIDGVLDEKTWQKAEPIEVESGKCAARLLWKRDGLYFGVSRRESQAAGKDKLRIMIDCDNNPKTCREIEINLRDASCKTRNLQGIDVATRTCNSLKGSQGEPEHSCTAEISVPFNRLLDAKKKPIRMNGIKWKTGFELFGGQKDTQKLVEIEFQGIPTPVMTPDERSKPYVTGTFWKDICEDYPFLGSQWYGCGCVSDGRCFFAVSSHQKHPAHLFCYDPAKNDVKLVADISEVVGEKGKGDGVTQQGKIHSEMLELDGVLYFGTCISFSPSESRKEAALKYIGGYFLGYDLRTGSWRTKFCGVKHGYIIQIGIDRKNRLIYGLIGMPREISHGNHLVRWDLDKDTVEDTGVINYDSWVSRDMMVDDKGRVYWANHGGSIGMYDPAGCGITVLEEDILPVYQPLASRRTDPDSAVRSLAWGFDKWRWILRDEKTKDYYAMVFDSELLTTFDPSAPAGSRVRSVTSLTLDELAGRNEVGLRSLGVCQAGRHIIYCTWDSTHTIHLVAYNIDNRHKRDLGPLVTPDGRKTWMCHAASASPDGRMVYLVTFTYVDENAKVFSTDVMPWEDTFRQGDEMTICFVKVDLQKDFHNVTLP